MTSSAPVLTPAHFRGTNMVPSIGSVSPQEIATSFEIRRLVLCREPVGSYSFILAKGGLQATSGAAAARHSDRCRLKYCDVSGTEHALYVLAAQRALIRAQLPNSGSLATASAKGVP